VTEGLSVAIVTFNSAGVIGSCVAAVGRWLPGAEIIVVDNGSSDESVGIARAGSARVRAVTGAGNIGFGRACNLAADLAGAGHVLFLNPDARIVGVDERSLGEAMRGREFGLRVASLVGDAAGGAVGGPVALVRRERSWVRDVVHHAVGPLRPRELGPVRQRPPEAGGGRWASAAAMIVRREEFLRVGGFDPRFFVYYEDRELSARYRDAGLAIGGLPGFVVVHAGGGSSAAEGVGATSKAWEYLGWLEYVAIRGGGRRARLASRLTSGPRAASRRGVGALAARGIGGRRVSRKADELESVASRVEALAREDGSPAGGPPFCPTGRALVRRAGS
jgi:N-acetylglucosaminyl-diphospho-decaprenol L-rhamnosyltransferase